MKIVSLSLAALALAAAAAIAQPPGMPPAPAPHPVPAPPAPSAAELAAAPADAKEIAPGLVYRVLTPGKGRKHPASEDIVEFHAIGRTPDGTVLQDSFSAGKSERFMLAASFPAWRQALAQMVAGETARFWFAPGLLPKNKQTGISPAGIFDIRLLEVASLPPAPASVTTPDAKAKRGAHGGSWVVLKAGDGKDKIGLHDGALVNFTAWNEQGEPFNSWLSDKKPTLFPVEKVMPAFADCLLGMTEHEERMCWVPAEDNSGFPGAQHGALAFRLELVSNIDVGKLLEQKHIILPPTQGPPG